MADMTPEIERAARAIAARHGYPDAMIGDLSHDARAVISSLLPPSDAMVEAAARERERQQAGRDGTWDGPVNHLGTVGREAHRIAVRPIVEAALRAALDGPAKGGRDG